MNPRTVCLFVSCLALAPGAFGESVELLPQLAKAPYVFTSQPNAFAGKPDCKTATFDVKGAGLPDHGHAAALVLTVRATDEDTHAIEVALHDSKGGVWGSSALPIRKDWEDVTLPFDEMRYFTHWGLKPVGEEARPEAKLFTSIHFCFGKWLCADSLNKSHGFEVKSVRLEKLPPELLGMPKDHSLDEFKPLPGETDDTGRFRRAVRACRGHVLDVPAGTYRVSSTIHVEGGCSVRLHKSATVVAVKAMPFVFELIGSGGGRRGAHDYNKFFIGGRIDGAGLASCVRVTGYAHFTMRDSTFLNGKLYGLRVDGGYELMACNLYFKCVIPGLAGNSALYVNGGDSHYTDCVAVDYTIGVNEVRGGSNRFTRCHVWGGPLPPVKPGEEREMLKDSVNFRICGGSTILRDCYADTGKTGYELRGWETRLLGCSYFNNKHFNLDNVTIVRQPCGGRALVSECGFCKNMPHTKVYEGTGSVEWRNMLYSGFGAEDECPGALTFGKKTGKEQKAIKLAD